MILIQIIRHLPLPEQKVVLFVEFVIQTLASIHEVINIQFRRTPLYRNVISLQSVTTFLCCAVIVYILDGSSTDTALITPCRCKGTLQLVHRNCLERWVRTADTKSCEVGLFCQISKFRVDISIITPLGPIRSVIF